MREVETVGWKKGRVILIDQRLLPKKEIYRKYGSAKATAKAIRDMVVRGAPAIGCTAAFGLAAESFRLAGKKGRKSWEKALAGGIRDLLHARPTAINLAWAIERMRPLIAATPAAELPMRLLEEARAIHREDVESCKTMGRLGAAVLPDTGERPIRIMTHCNAGGLATAGYGTALGVIRAAHEAGRLVKAISNETRPYLQGARLTSWELVRAGIETTLVCDNMAGHLMSLGEVDAVVVGTDRVAANGDVANKIGTYAVAVLAARHGIPFFVACPLSTISLGTPTGADIPIEERAPEEVTHFAGRRVAAKGVKVRNPAFDVTPANLVTALITERGVVHAPDEEKIKALFSADG